MGPSLLALIFLGVALAPSPGLAQVYRWVDEQGKVYYSEGLNSVPSRYRSTAKPIEFPKAPPPAPEKTETEKKPSTSGEPAGASPGGQPASPASPEKKGPGG